MDVTRVSIDSIVPYWRNPRVISDEAVQAVADSITRFGYQSPIIVDKNFTVIAGHTRLQALRRLAVQEVEVVVADLTPEQAKQYRLVDNKTSEYGDWDTDKLFLELREFTDKGLTDRFFPEIDLSDAVATSSVAPIDLEEISRAVESLNARVSGGTKEEPRRTVLCPHCYQEFAIST
jgi:ParB-like chromosome segregation protein Spo0J